MKLLVIDGQGGKMGRAIVEQLKKELPEQEITAIGTNSIATSTMLKAGADMGATGENPVIFNCKDADIVIGPIGIIAANSLLGEVTPSMAAAISSSKAVKILIPINKCNVYVAGIKDLTLSEYVKAAVEQAKELISKKKCQ
ncbi:MAG: DUF3842 family protein [Clostridiales bacterium]|nr:DUF3842 family protein [Clostridiales bacterium]